MILPDPDDFNGVLDAVNQSGRNLEYASSRLRGEPEIVLAAVLRHPQALVHASKPLLNNKQFILSIFHNLLNGSTYVAEVLVLLSKKFKNDKDIVLAAVNKNGMAIKEAGEDPRNVKRIALAAIENSPRAFQYVSEALRGNFDVAHKAVCADYVNLQFLKSTALYANKTIIYDALHCNVDAFYFLSSKLQHHNVINYLYEHANKISKSDWPTVREALLKNPELVLNPPAPIVAIFAGNTLPYLAIAQYALNHDVVCAEVESFDFI